MHLDFIFLFLHFCPPRFNIPFHVPAKFAVDAYDTAIKHRAFFIQIHKLQVKYSNLEQGEK